MVQPRPSVIVLAAARPGRGERPVASTLSATLAHAIASALPVVVVAPESLVPAARAQVAGRDVVALSDAEAERGLGRAIAAGVAACADASGWVLLPAGMSLVRASTIAAVAQALDQHPVAYAQHAGRPGQPVGFAAELYSELVQLDGDDGARRLVARYPSVGVDVDDPGTLLGTVEGDDLSLLRVVAGGSAAALATAR
jgi:molybdenum cofactor cytidylyltransferase